MTQPNQNTYLLRSTVTSLFEPSDIAGTFGYLFVPISPIADTQKYIDPITISKGTVPNFFVPSREKEILEMRESSHFSTVLTVTPTLTKELGSKIGFFMEGKENYMTLAEYESVGHAGMNIVGMTFNMRDNEMSESERGVILKHMAIFRENKQEMMSEDSVRPFECLHIGKAAASILRKDLKAEGRLPELTEIETYLLNTHRYSELVSEVSLAKKK